MRLQILDHAPNVRTDAHVAQRKLAACTCYITLGDLPSYNNTQIRSLDDGQEPVCPPGAPMFAQGAGVNMQLREPTGFI